MTRSPRWPRRWSRHRNRHRRRRIRIRSTCPEPLSAEEARPADAFVDFIGVNTHLGYQDTTYRDYEGIIKPRQCRVFGTACTPEMPLGALMVSSEGACAAYYRYRARRAVTVDA